MPLPELYVDYRVEIASESDRHYRPGWLNTECPFCTGNPGHHLGYNLQNHYYYCWRCGGHDTIYTLTHILRVSQAEAKQLLKIYNVSRSHGRSDESKVTKVNALKLPSDLTHLNKIHKKYLRERNLKPCILAENWQVRGTGMFSTLDGLNYCQRIFVPVFWHNKMVSFVTRDCTGKSSKKYLVCPLDREIIPHKSIVFCKDGILPKKPIIMEGAFDVFRVGYNGVATFGIDYTHEQLNLLGRTYASKEAYIWYDPESQAQRQAQKLKRELNARGVIVHIISSETDPADTPQEEVDYIIKQL